MEIVRRAFEAFGRGDLDAMVENVDADVVMRPPETWEAVQGGAAHGRDAVKQLFADYREALGQHVEVEEQIDAGDRVVTRHLLQARGEYSGIEGELRFSMVNTLRNGLTVMIEVFSDHDDALRAVGLRE